MTSIHTRTTIQKLYSKHLLTYSTGYTLCLSLTDDERVRREESQSPSKASSVSSPVPSSRRHCAPNVTVIHPSANHPMFSYLCQATGGLPGMSGFHQPYPGLFSPMDMPASAASFMNPFLFSQLLRQQFPPVSGIEGAPSLSPTSAIQAYSRAHRFSPYGLPISAAAGLPPTSSLRNPISAASGDLKSLLSNFSSIKGEV